MWMKLTNGKLTEVILDSLGEGLFTVDKDFRINSLNRAGEQMFIVKKSEVIGDFCKNVFKSKRCFGECPIERVLENGASVFDLESEMVTKKGRRVPVKINANVLKDTDNKPIGGVVSFRDMSHLETIQKNLVRASGFHGVIGRHKSMLEIYNLIEEVADSRSSVMITGESGTGKEMIADAIQQISNRKNKPFVKINCSVSRPSY